jgi:cytochrome b involved in lipid metabolism
MAVNNFPKPPTSNSRVIAVAPAPTSREMSKGSTEKLAAPAVAKNEPAATQEARRPSMLQQLMERTTSDAASTVLITKAELLQHDRHSSAPWTVIKGKVFDLSGFLKSHPGGRGALLDNAGKDGTKEFTDSHSYIDPMKEERLKVSRAIATKRSSHAEASTINSPLCSFGSQFIGRFKG